VLYGWRGGRVCVWRLEVGGHEAVLVLLYRGKKTASLAAIS